MTSVFGSKKIQKIQYLSYFVARSFFLAILCFVCFLTFLFMLYFVSLSINSKNPIFGTYIIVSPSMVPTIKINDAIVIKRENNDKYNVGDIITFSSSDSQYEGLTVTHRIINKVDEAEGISKYTTKGDNNYIADAVPVTTNDIYGKVLFKIPKIGYVQNFFSKPTNFFLSLLIPGIIFAFYEIARIFIMLLYEKEV